MRGRKEHTYNTLLTYAIIAFVFFYGILLVYRNISESSILDRSDRINIVFYGEYVTLISFGITDSVNYIVSFDNEDRVSIPGGYDRYALGSLGRLAEIEKDPDLLKRAFSSMISGYVDFYTFHKNAPVYDATDSEAPSYNRTDLIKTIMSRENHSNMSFFDKLYVSFLIARRRQQDFVSLKNVSVLNEKDDVYDFSERGFQKKYEGFFFHQLIREESLDVQMIYKSAKSAQTLARVIEGQGIRVVDLSLYTEDKMPKRCILIMHKDVESTHTVRFLKRKFDCTIKEGVIEGSDIQMIAGLELEEAWK